MTDGTEKSLPLEGKVVRLKPDRMRSKVTASYQPMVKIVNFDLISQPLRAASFSSRGSLFSEAPGQSLLLERARQGAGQNRAFSGFCTGI